MAMQPRQVDGAVRDVINDMKTAEMSKLISASASSVSASNTTNETTLFSATVPGGLLGTARVLRFRGYLSSVSHNNFSDDLTLRVKYGSGVLTITLTDNSGAISGYTGWLDMTLVANGATGSQLMVGEIRLDASTAIYASGNDYGANASQAMAIDSTSNQTFAVTAQWNNAHASNGVTMQGAFLELL